MDTLGIEPGASRMLSRCDTTVPMKAAPCPATDSIRQSGLSMLKGVCADGPDAVRGYGAMAAQLTPDQKVGSSDLTALISAWLEKQPCPEVGVI